jgi:Protein of unknown function (DUF3800)
VRLIRLKHLTLASLQSHTDTRMLQILPSALETPPREVYELGRHFLNDGKGYVAVLKVFMDESGTHDGSPVVTVAAYLATPRVWQGWTKDWNRAKRPIKVVHAADCNNLKGEFEGWDKDRRDAWVAQLLPVIPRHNIMGVAVGIQMDAFRREMASRSDLQDLFGTPYTACFQWAVQSVMAKASMLDPEMRVSFVHEGNDYKDEAFEAFDFVRERYGNRAFSLAFAGKTEYVPLQAADILAYEANHMLRDPVRKLRPTWQCLDPDDEVPLVWVRHYGEANMGDFVRRLEALNTKGLH